MGLKEKIRKNIGLAPKLGVGVFFQLFLGLNEKCSKDIGFTPKLWVGASIIGEFWNNCTKITNTIAIFELFSEWRNGCDIHKFCKRKGSSWHVSCTKTSEYHNYRGKLKFISDFLVMSSGGSRISPRRGRQLPGGGANIRFCQIFPKTAWNWMNLDPGGRASLAPPLDPPRDNVRCCLKHCGM